jgi:hypothetical protein
MRVLAGVGAWLVGVGAATAGSLLAVSLLGQGIATSTSQQLTAGAVNRALAAEASDSNGVSPVATTSPRPSPSRTRSRQVEPSLIPQETGIRPSAQASRSRPASSATKPAATASPSSTALTSQGGTVVAECRAGGAYLVSWSPTQGYEAGPVFRGPAVTAQVTFESAANAVHMVVSCSAGTPNATSTVSSSGTGTGGGGGGDGGGPDS